MRLRSLAAVTLALSAFACSSTDSPSDEDQGAFTSVTGRERHLVFQGVVYVAPDAQDVAILDRALIQARSAFGALRGAGMVAQTRELHAVDARSFKKRNVTVIDPTVPNDPGKPMMEVRYTYEDTVVVEAKLGDRTSYALALMNPEWPNNLDKITTQCVESDRESRDDSRNGDLWYYFDPNLPNCRKAIDKEDAAVKADAARITGQDRIPKSQTTRFYYPINIALEAKATNDGLTYPEYQKLFKGGVQENKLVVGLLNGRLEHDFVDAGADFGYHEWMSALKAIFDSNDGFELVSIEPQEDISTVTVGSKTLTGLKFNDYIKWSTETGGFTTAERKARVMAGGKKLDKHWLTFDRKVKVAVGNEQPRDFTIEILTYFGVEDQVDTYKRMMKSSDVFVYNGHSYLGSGPLDPANFTAADFPQSYQLFFLDGCISYNYYNRDYFPLKGGSKNLDLIVNGLEAPEDGGGEAEGVLIGKLINGRHASYKTLLEAAKATDPLRVVEGEADNEYQPDKIKLSVTKR